MRKGCRRSHGSIRFGQSIESTPNCLGEHCEFRSTLLLFDNHKWFVEFGIAGIDLLAQDVNLRVLAAQAALRAADPGGLIVSRSTSRPGFS